MVHSLRRWRLEHGYDPHRAPAFAAPWLGGNPFDYTTDTRYPRLAYNGTAITKLRLILARRAEDLEESTEKEARTLRVPSGALATMQVREEEAAL